MKILFTKMHGTGNDFIIIDEFKKVLIAEKKKPSFVKKISDRHFGVGSDGIIVVQKSKKNDARFVFYNPDGSRAEMCGNGIRCFAKYLYEHNIVKKNKIVIETLAGSITAELKIKNSKVFRVRVDMGWPRLKRKDIPVAGYPSDTFINKKVTIEGRIFRITAVGMGNPHAVIFVKNVDSIDVKKDGFVVRYHKKLFPKGTNVHFVQKIKDNEFRIRTYERGVEDETLACGTGICASAVAVVLNKLADPKKQILFNAIGGDVKIELDYQDNNINRIYLIGPAEEVFSAKIDI